MSELAVPAPLWRRLIASIYDGLLLVGLWMVTLLLSLPLNSGMSIYSRLSTW